MKHLLYALCIMAIFASCNQTANTGSSASEQVTKNKAVAQKFFDEIYSKHNVSAMDSMVAADFVEHEIDPGYEPTREGTKKDFVNFFKIFPDMTSKINFVVADSDKVVIQGSFAATQSGEMMGKAPSNKKVSVDGLDAYRINKDGKIVEHWGYYEERKMMMQLGEIPDPKDSTKTSAAPTTTTTTTTVTKETSKEVIKKKK